MNPRIITIKPKIVPTPPTAVVAIDRPFAFPDELLILFIPVNKEIEQITVQTKAIAVIIWTILKSYPMPYPTIANGIGTNNKHAQTIEITNIF